MVNGATTRGDEDRRRRERVPARHASALGMQNLNPFGDLHTLQHLSARLARALRALFEPLLRREVRAWAEPLVVQRFADYRAERPDGLTGWLPLTMNPGGQALLVLDGRWALELLDLFFGGAGVAPQPLPTEFTPAAEATITRIGRMIADPVQRAWEPLSHVDLQVGRLEASPALLQGVDAEDAMVVTRFGIAAGTAKPVWLDIVYPVSVLKPHAPTLTGKVVGKGAAPDAAWRTGLTRAVMDVRFPIRSVLAEPMVPLAMLMELKMGDVIPISVGGDVPVMVGGDRLGVGTVGTSNGKAAIKLTAISYETTTALGGDFQ
ncbi:MAG: flagellar motor switch protein FliM [Sphingomonadaceae bacterium]|nr:flagellar motor switch protein FliM [Sphingomonadaceae bacterium]